jgi:hypothetical protein
MQKTQDGKRWFFVDESGDPTIYDKKGNLIVGQEGCSPILLLGMIEVSNPDTVRQALKSLQTAIAHDPYFVDFPSISKTAIAFHAKDDVPEVRYEVYKLLTTLDFDAQFVVARKIERVFRNNFEAQEGAFYDHLVTQLFQNKLHRYQENIIYFAKRGSRNRQIPLAHAIEKGIQQFENKWKVKIQTRYSVQAQTPAGEPCLSVIDYMNWAVYRAFTRQEMRYFRVIENKVSLLVDMYDKEKYPRNWYSRKNRFDVKKITPL